MLRFPPILAESSHSSSSNVEPSKDIEVGVCRRFSIIFPVNLESLISKTWASTASRTSTSVSKNAPRTRTPSRGMALLRRSDVSMSRRKSAPTLLPRSSKRSSVFRPDAFPVFSLSSKSATSPLQIFSHAHVSALLHAAGSVDASRLHACSPHADAADVPDAETQTNIALQWTDTDRVTAPPGAPLASAAWLRSKRSGGGGGR